MRLLREVIGVEFAEGQIVLVQKDVCKIEIQILVDQLRFHFSVEVKHVYWQAKGEHCRS